MTSYLVRVAHRGRRRDLHLQDLRPDPEAPEIRVLAEEPDGTPWQIAMVDIASIHRTAR